LKALVKALLGIEMDKSVEVIQGDWALRPLSERRRPFIPLMHQ